MSDHEIVEMRHPARSSDEDRAATLDALDDGLEDSGIGRRPLIRNSLFGAIGVLLLAPIVMLRDLGPTPSQVEDAEEGKGLEHTIWKENVRVVRDVVGTPIRPGDLSIGDLVNAVPDGIFALEGVELQVAKAKSAVIVVKMEPDEIKAGRGPRELEPRGRHLLLEDLHPRRLPDLPLRAHHAPRAVPVPPVYFSISPTRAKVIFGPAARPLPQLPLALDSEGFLVAQSDFTEPVGPSYWERVE